RNSAAPSPMLMPLRLREKGLQRCADTDSSALKPPMVKPHSESAPPAITASTMPARSSLAADASAFAPDEHAVEIVQAGPRAPDSRAMNRDGAPISCWA